MNDSLFLQFTRLLKKLYLFEFDYKYFLGKMRNSEPKYSETDPDPGTGSSGYASVYIKHGSATLDSPPPPFIKHFFGRNCNAGIPGGRYLIWSAAFVHISILVGWAEREDAYHSLVSRNRLSSNQSYQLSTIHNH